MKYLKVFTDFAETLEPLGDAEKGRLFMAMLQYAETSELPDLRGNERIIWPTAKLHIDRERALCEKQRANGLNGGRPITQNNPNKPTITQITQKDKDKDKDKECVPPISPRGFEDFWQAYPKKIGKQAAMNAWKKLHVSNDLLDKILFAVQQQRSSPQWTKEGGQYIPNPTTWLNQGRWDDEVRGNRYEELMRQFEGE